MLRGSRSRLAASEPIIDIRDVQGDLVLGFNRTRTFRLLFTFSDPGSAKAMNEVKCWLKTSIFPLLTSCADVRLYRDSKKLPGGHFPADSIVWGNVAFGFPGLEALLKGTEYEPSLNGFDQDDGLPTYFKLGAARNAMLFGDQPSTWQWGQKANPDMLMTLAGDDLKSLDATVASIKHSLSKLQHVSLVNDGAIKAFRGTKNDPNNFLYGHEHYGFHDGLSEPMVRGHYQPTEGGASVPIVKRYVKPSDKRSQQYSAPGFELIDTAHFLLGKEYIPHQEDGKPVKGFYNTVPAYPDWAKNGSFSVFRQLSQDVWGFWDSLLRQAQATVKPGETVEDVKKRAGRLGAEAVGRWWDGTPLTFPEPLTGHYYPPKSGTTGINFDKAAQMTWEKNGFTFLNPQPKWPMTTGSDIAPPSLSEYPTDVAGNGICPFASHIRKVNPRDMSTDQGPASETLKHRIIRRGNNYGDRVIDVFKKHDGEGEERGLSLVTYQASIEDQFAFLQRTWANSDVNPVHGGDDMIIGLRGAGAKPAITRTMKTSLEENKEIKFDQYFTKAVGMGYFLLPSMSALTKELTTPSDTR